MKELTNRELILLDILAESLIYYSVGKGICKVVTNLGTFYGKTLNEALTKAYGYEKEVK